MKYDIRVRVKDNGEIIIDYLEDGEYYTIEDIDALHIKFSKNDLKVPKLNIAVSIPEKDVNLT